MAEGRLVVRRVLEDARCQVQSLLLNDTAYRDLAPVVDCAGSSVNDLVVEQIVDLFEVRDFQRAHGLDGHIQRFVGTTSPALLAQVPSCGAQDAENLRSIESLPFTVLAEAHDCSATTAWVCVPTPSIVHTAVSPARIHRGSASSMFVPAGLPPEITSPGLSVKIIDA